MKISIIIVKYNQPDYERRTAQSVLKYTHAPYDLIAYQNLKGVGLSKVWNKLVSESNGDYICLLNSDIVVTDHWLERLIECYENGDPLKLAVLTPVSNFVGANLSIKVPFDRFETNFQIIDNFAQKLWNEKGPLVEFKKTLSGYCMFFKRCVWEDVGGFDERFFLYSEDREWFDRVARKGYILGAASGIYLHHYGSVSIRKSQEDGEISVKKTVSASKKLINEILKTRAIQK